MGPEQRARYQAQLNDALIKRKKALIAVCTLGLSETPLVKIFKDSDDTTKQMSFANSPGAWIFQAAWFLFLTFITMAVFWIINIFKLINYAVFSHRLKKLLETE